MGCTPAAQRLSKIPSNNVKAAGAVPSYSTFYSSTSIGRNLRNSKSNGRFLSPQPQMNKLSPQQKTPAFKSPQAKSGGFNNNFLSPNYQPPLPAKHKTSPIYNQEKSPKAISSLSINSHKNVKPIQQTVYEEPPSFSQKPRQFQSPIKQLSKYRNSTDQDSRESAFNDHDVSLKKSVTYQEKENERILDKLQHSFGAAGRQQSTGFQKKSTPNWKMLKQMDSQPNQQEKFQVIPIKGRNF